MNVISLAASREARQPHWAGIVVCAACGHEHEAIGPIGETENLACPACHAHRAHLKYDFSPPEGSRVASCHECGHDTMRLFYPPDSHTLHLLCPRCGETGEMFNV